MKLSSIQESRPTLALVEAAAEVFTHIIYTIDENYDFFGRMMSSARGGRGRGYTDSSGRYTDKPQLKDKSSFSTEAAWLKHKQEYDREMEQYFRDKAASKSSGGKGTSGGGAPQDPYTKAASNIIGAGAAALKSKIAPGASSSSDTLLALFTGNRLNAADLKVFINTAATLKSDILNDETLLTQLFDKFPNLDASSRNDILATTKLGAVRIESTLATACSIIENYDAVLVENALRMTSVTLAKKGYYISEAGVRRMFDAARRFVAQPQAVAASAQQSKLKSANISNAKLLVQNVIKHYEQRLNAAGVRLNQLDTIMNDPTKLNQLKQKLGIH